MREERCGVWPVGERLGRRGEGGKVSDVEG